MKYKVSKTIIVVSGNSLTPDRQYRRTKFINMILEWRKATVSCIGIRRQSLRMRFLEQLSWCLSKVVDYTDRGSFLHNIGDSIKIYQGDKIRQNGVDHFCQNLRHLPTAPSYET